MEFWGHEVRPGTTLSCKAGDGSVTHLSQVSLGETKKGADNVVVFVKVGDEKLAIGTLSADNHPQISLDLIFSEAFELSHNSKTNSVFLSGYKVDLPDMFESDSGEDEDEELETDEISVKENKTEKPAAKEAKDGIKDKQDDDNESDDSESSSETETSSGTDDSMSEDDSSDDSEDEEILVKPKIGKEIAVPTALKTPPSYKKADISTSKKETGVDSSGDDSESSSEIETSSGTDDSISEDYSSDDSEDEEILEPEVGKKRAVPTALKTPASQKKAKISTLKETGVDFSDDSSGDDSESSSETETSSGTDDSMSEDDSSDDSEDEEIFVKPEVSKKRIPTALKTPASDKEAKFSKPKNETGDKKSVHVATPHPAKLASKTQQERSPKTPADSKAKKSPKSGSHSCTCSKTSNSAAARESHRKAKKHEAKSKKGD